MCERRLDPFSRIPLATWIRSLPKTVLIDNKFLKHYKMHLLQCSYVVMDYCGLYCLQYVCMNQCVALPVLT